jgi:transcription elongation factor GreA
MPDLVPMTRAGYDKIRAEMERLENVEMPKIEARIGRARDEGDLSENAEYHGQREAKALLQAKINVLRDKLARAAIVDPAQMPADEVALGATVVVKDLDFAEEETFTLVGAGEEDYDAGRILVTSPIGQGLLGKKVGQTTHIEVPKGVLRLEVLEIRYGEA